MTATAAQPVATWPLRWARARGLAWMTWRLQRTTYITTATVFGVLAVVLLVNGLAMHGDYTAAGLASCGPLGSARCQVPLGLFEGNYQSWAMYVPRAVMFIPGLLAAFAGAPLIAREIESGTYRFAWTQARTRTSWLAAKVILVIAPITAAALAFSVLFGWWFSPFEPLMGRMASGQAYEVSGTVFGARMAFGIALGLLAGTLVRRVVPAMAITLAAWVATTWITIVYLRPAIERPLDVPSDSSLITRGGWAISDYFRGPSGAHIGAKGNAIGALYARAKRDGVTSDKTFLTWLARHGYVHYATFQPESRFWHFQLIETSGYLAVTIALASVLFWQVRRAR